MPQYPNLVIDADLSISGVGQLSNARIQNVTSAGRLTLQQELITSEAAGNTHAGQIIFDVDIQTLFIFVSANSQFEPVSFNQQGDVMFKGVINPTNANTNTTAGAESGSGSAGTDSDSGVDSGSTGGTTTTTYEVTGVKYAVVSAPNDDDSGPNSGSVYVYDMTDLTAAPTKLTAFDGAADDGFGAMYNTISSHGDKLFIASPADDDNSASSSGSVYVFDVNDFSAQPIKLVSPNPLTGAQFGNAISATAEKVVIGSIEDTGNVAGSGAAYVYDMSDLTAAPTKLFPSDGAAQDKFGFDIASNDSYIVIGAYNSDNGRQGDGSIYVYDATDLTAAPTKLSGAPNSNGNFGWSVDINDTHIVVGQKDNVNSNGGTAFVYDLSDLSATPTELTRSDAAASDFFGWSVSLNDDYAFVGAFKDDDDGTSSGSVYAYQLSNLSAAPTKLTAPDAATEDRFGRSLSAMGDSLIVSSYINDDNGTNSGSVYVYDTTNLSSAPTKLTAFDGAEYDLYGNVVEFVPEITATTTSSGSGDTGSTGSTTTTTTSQGKYVAVISNKTVNSNKQVTVYDNTDLTASPITFTAPDVNLYWAASPDEYAVAISGTTLFVGAAAHGGSARGGVYVYDIENPSAAPSVIVPSDISNFDQFGTAVATSEDYLAVSSIGHDGGGTTRGAIYLYDLTDLSAAPTVLTASTATDGNELGQALAISSDYVAAGSWKDDTHGTNTGAVYVWDLSDLTADAVKLTVADNTNNFSFGDKVALSTTHLAAHSTNDDVSAGSVYVYDLSDLTAAPAKLDAANAGIGANNFPRFGESIVFSGSTLFVGADGDDTDVGNAGRVYTYDLTNLSSTPTGFVSSPTAENGAQFGSALGVSGDNLYIAAMYGDNGGSTTSSAGEIWVYDINDLSTTPTRLSQNVSFLQDGFFIATAPVITTTTTTSSGSGDTGSTGSTTTTTTANWVVVGAPRDNDNGVDSGSLYVYDANDLSAQPTKLTAFDGAASDEFSYSIAATSDKIVVGAHADDDNGSKSGSVYVYDANDLSAQPTKLTAFDGVFDDFFGRTVAVTADKIVVGATRDDDNGSMSGSVYVFDANDLSAQPTKLTAFDGAEMDFFGISIATTFDKIIVGAMGDDDNGSNSGSVYVYDANDLSAQPTKLTAFDAAENDDFGRNVAATNDKIVVGAQYDDDNNANGSGSVYVFDANDLSAQPTKLTAFDAATSDQFGSAVAVTSDKVIVGAYADDDNGSMSGSVYVYDANDLSAQPTKLTAFDGAENDYFGTRVAATSDKIVVGAKYDDDNGSNSGSVYVYDANDLTAQPTKLTAFDGDEGDYFGASLAIGSTTTTTTTSSGSGDTGSTGSTTTTTTAKWVVVGAQYDDDNGTNSGSVYVYDANDLSAQPTKLTAFDGDSLDSFGSPVAATADKIIVGAIGDDDNGSSSGSVYVYDVNDLSAQPTKLTAFDGAEGDSFGRSVATTSDKIIVSAVFDDDNGNASSGSVYVYDANDLSATPTKLTAFDGAEYDYFGWSVAATADKIIVGAQFDDDKGSNSGSVYVYDANDLSATPTKLTAFDGDADDRFGFSIAATSDKIVLGSPNDEDNGSNSGSVYVYDANNLSATPTKLTAFDGAADDYFGRPVVVTSDKIVVGAWGDDDNGSSSGSVYVFDANDLSATPTKLTAFDGAENDRFGISVAAIGDKIVVGAQGDDSYTGSVYVYDANDLTAQPTKLTAFDGDEGDYFGASLAIGFTTTTTTSSGSGAGTDSTSTEVVTEGALVDTSIGGIFSVPGFQYVVDTAGTLVRDGVTFYPNGQVEVGDIVLFTSATEAYVLQSNVSPATIDKAGTINLATQAAVDAGVIDSDAVTPATFAGSQLAAQIAQNTTDQNTNATNIASLQTFTGEGTALSTSATDLAAAINELVGRADSSATEIDGLEALVGEGTILSTVATSLAAGLNELVARQDSSDAAILATEADIASLQTFTGEGTSLDTTAADLAAAINELHGEIVTNASEIAANTADIAPTTASILVSTNEIAANAIEIDGLTTRIDNIDSDMAVIQNTITSLYSQVSSNDTDIATIFSTFGSNDSELASLVARMLTAEGNIIANDSDILALQPRITSVEGNHAANDSDILANSALISSLETYFGSDSLNTSAITLAGAINELHSNADANAAAILGNDSDILGLQTLFGSGPLSTTATTLAGAINELQGEITANDSDIAVLTGQISTVESQDDVKAFNKDNITFVADVEQTINHNLDLEFITGFTIAVMDGTGDMIEATIRALDSNSIGIMTEFDVSNASMFMLANLSAPVQGDIPPGTVMTQSGGYVVTQGGVYVVLNGYTGGGTSTESGTDSSSPAPAPAPEPEPEPEPEPTYTQTGLVLHLDAANPASYSGSGNWIDLTGNGGDATLNNGMAFDAANEGSFAIDGVDDFAQFPSTALVSGNGAFTNEFWFKWSGAGGNQVILGYGNDSGPGVVNVSTVTNNKFRFEFGSGAGIADSTTTINTGTWYHAAVAYDQSSVKVYINGVLEATTAYSSANVPLSGYGGENGSIGALFSTWGNVSAGGTRRYGTFGGNVSVVRQYNRALNGTEIQFNYDASKDRYNEAPTISGIDASYTLATGSDTVITGVATDPEGDAITWSYEVISGDLAGTTVAQADNVFTVSHGLQDTNFTLRFKATDSAGNVTSHDATFAFSYTNQAPTISGVASAYTLTQGQDTVITASATDPEGDAVTFSFEVPTTASADDYTITGLYSNTLVEVSDGLSLTISNGNSWESYQNLPTYLQGLLTTTTINDTESSTWTIPACTAYMVRANHWNTVPTTGWTLIESGKSYISGHNNVVDVYSKTFAAGSYEFNNNSAMYLFDGEIIAEQINVALDATSTASTHISDRPPSLAHDGIIGISDTDGSTISNLNAWVTTGEGVGAWMQLDWSTPQTVNKIKLYDRPNVTHDHIKGGTLTFSDGSSVTVGELPDGVVNGAPDPLEVTFDAKTITWVRFTVDAFTGHNAGLTEFEVFSLSASVNGTIVSQDDNVFTITPGTQSTDFDLSITATDSNNNASTVTSDISFTYINQHPVVSGISSAYTLVKDQDTVITGVATDPEGDAITWSYDIAEEISASDFTLTGMYNNNLATSANGLTLTIDPAGNGWKTYQNLPTYLTGLLCTTGINEGDSLSFTIPACTVYMLRVPNWDGVDTTGWTEVESGQSYLTDYSGMTVYSKEFSAGTYNFDNQSAMYMFAGETIDMTVSQTDNVFTITPGTTDISTQVTFTATDSAGNSTSVSSDITFEANAAAPTISGVGANYTLTEGQDTVISVVTDDADGDTVTLTYAVTAGDLAGTTISRIGDEFTVTPGSQDTTFQLTFTADDSLGKTETAVADFTYEYNSAPVISGIGASYTLVTGEPTTITGSATDAEGQAITWSYIVTSGALAGSTVSQADNVFTVTPGSEDATFQLTFTATDAGGKSTSSASDFTHTYAAPAQPGVPVVIENSSKVALLLDASSTANDTIVDSSSNAHAITVNGDVSQSSFSPYRSGGYSWAFDGDGDYLSMPKFDLGSDSFTVECWMNVSSENAIIVGSHLQGQPDGWYVYYDASSIHWSNFNNGNGSEEWIVPHGLSTMTGQWHHIAVAKDSSNTMRMFLNGVMIGSKSDNGNYVNSPSEIFVGAVPNVSSGLPVGQLNGSISDLRIVKGTAVYTGTFLVPSERLTAVTGTSLLTCNLPYLQSGLTVHGDVSPVAAGPYDYAGYSEAKHGGSYVFDGNGDIIKTPYSEDFAFGTGDFTVEFWLNYRGGNGYRFFWNLRDDPDYIGYGLQNNSLTPWLWQDGDVAVANTNITPNMWQHHAVVRNNGVIKIYLDGTEIASANYTNNIAANKLMCIGGNGVNNTQDTNGLYSDFRVIKGTAVYTENFSVPTAPLEAVTGTSLLLSGNNAAIRDESQTTEKLTVHGSIPSSDSSPYGSGKSMDFSGSYITSSDGIDFSDNDFTIELWWYPTDAGRQGLFHGSYGADWSIGIDYNSTYNNPTLGFWASSTGSSWDIANSDPGGNGITTGSPTQNAWNHIAYVRNGSTLTMYLNGVNVGEVTGVTAPIHSKTKTHQQSIGTWWKATGWGGGPMSGNVEDYRISLEAIYTAEFTPPSKSMGDYEEAATTAGDTDTTSVATAVSIDASSDVTFMLDPSPTATGSIIDVSDNSHAVTVNGNVSQSSFSPYRSGGYSWEFDGSGDYLTSSNENGDFSFGNGDFTIETWAYYKTMPSGNGYPASAWILGGGPTNSNTGFDIAIGSTNIQVGLSSFLNLNINAPHGISAGEWYHIAIVRNGSDLSFYRNGTLIVSADVSGVTADVMSTGIAVGAAEPSGAVSGNPNAIYSDVRVVKGTAVYTADFTPTTERLTEVTGTSLLTCNLPYLQSGLTVHGDVSPVAAGPYDYAGYSESLHGGSYVFDGDGDYLQASNHASLAMGSSDFTIEGWLNVDNNANSTYPTWIANWSGGWQTHAWSLHTNHSAQPNKFTFYCYNYSTHGPLLESSLTVKENTWYHVSLTRSGSTFNLWVNGKLEATATFAGALDGGAQGGIFLPSNFSDNRWSGSISDFRIVKDTAVYTEDFTPPTAPLEAVTGTSLLLAGNNADIRDESQSTRSMTVYGNTTLSDETPTYVVDTSSTSYGIEFDGSSDYLRADEALDSFTSTTDSFTIEFRMRPKRFDNGTIVEVPFAINSISTGSNELIFVGRNQGSSLAHPYITVSSSSYSIGRDLQDNGPWHHIAMTYDGTRFKLYVDGTVAISENVSFNIPFADCSLLIGADADSANAGSLGNWYEGLLSDIRITKAVVYTDNFTPTTPTVTADTEFYLSSSVNAIQDSSSNVHTVNVYGNTTVVEAGDITYIGKSIDFDGSGDYIRADEALSSFTSGTQPFTIEMYVKADSTSGEIFFFGLNSKASGYNNLIFGFANGTWRFHVNNSSTDTGSISSGTWYHTAIVYDGATTIKCYINGSELTSRTWHQPLLSESTFTVGGEADAANAGSMGNWFNGKISNLRISKFARYTENFTAPSNPMGDYEEEGGVEQEAVNSAPVITGIETSYTLPTGVATTITAVATDADGDAITWSYAVTSGSLGDTTVSQADNVFTVTTGNLSATFELTFIATDANGAVTSFSSDFTHSYSIYPIPMNGLFSMVDAAGPSITTEMETLMGMTSYSGSGDTWYDISGNGNDWILRNPNWNSSAGRFEHGEARVCIGPDMTSIADSDHTMIWIYVTTDQKAHMIWDNFSVENYGPHNGWAFEPRVERWYLDKVDEGVPGDQTWGQVYPKVMDGTIHMLETINHLDSHFSPQTSSPDLASLYPGKRLQWNRDNPGDSWEMSNGGFYGFMIYSRKLTDAERSQIFDYWKERLPSIGS